eukprot:9617565-Alexandrium_andersonii.AAC.1
MPLHCLNIYAVFLSRDAKSSGRGELRRAPEKPRRALEKPHTSGRDPEPRSLVRTRPEVLAGNPELLSASWRHRVPPRR